MGSVKLTRNLGIHDAGALDLKLSEAREGKQVDVEGDVRDELVLQGLAYEGDDSDSGGLDLTDPEIRKKLEERELELNLAGGLVQLQYERQQEEVTRMIEVESELKTERDRLREEMRKKGEKFMEELRNQAPKGPDDQPREILGGVMKMRTSAGRDEVEVEGEEEEGEKRRREQERRGQPQPAPSSPRQPQPAQPQPQPARPAPGQTPSKK